MAAKLSMPIAIVAFLQNLQQRFSEIASLLADNDRCRGIRTTRTYRSPIQRHNPRVCLVATPES